MENGIIMDSELNKVIELLIIISNNNLTVKLSEIDMTNNPITIIQFNDIINLGDTPIIVRLISEQVINLFKDINEDAYVEGSSKDIKYSELEKLNQAIMGGYIVFENNELSGSLDVKSITVENLDSLLIIESLIIHREMSKEIKNALDVPENSIMQNEIDIYYDEVKNVLDALTKLGLGITNLNDLDIDTLTINSSQFASLLNQTFNDGYSPIITRLISNNIVKSLGDEFNEEAFEDNQKDFKRSELEALRNALFVLDVGEISNDLNVDNANVSKIIEIIGYKSVILDRLISKQIISAEELIKPETVYINKDKKDIITDIELINLLRSANSIDGVNTIKQLIEFFNKPTIEDLEDVYDENKDKDEDEKSQILIATLMDKLGL